VIVFVEKIEGLPNRGQSATPIMLTPVALFQHGELYYHSILKQQFDQRGFGYAFVHSVGPSGRLDGAADWIEAYAAEHGGRIVTNFDERSPILSNAPLSYQRLINRTYDRIIIEQLHLQSLAKHIDVAVTNEYNNYGQVAAMGNDPRSDNNVFQEAPSQASKPDRHPKSPE
jgi:hypothetical protein